MSKLVKSTWYVYLVRCADSTLYTGITTDVERRVAEHNGELGKKKGAKYTAARRPVELVYKKRCQDRSAAAVAEAALRKLSKIEKQKLVKRGSLAKSFLPGTVPRAALGTLNGEVNP